MINIGGLHRASHLPHFVFVGGCRFILRPAGGSGGMHIGQESGSTGRGGMCPSLLASSNEGEVMLDFLSSGCCWPLLLPSLNS